jgi:hypothetical protein
VPFGSWMSINHPDDMLTMYTDKHGSGVRYTEDSNRLWEQRSAEYVAVVKQNPAAYLDQPEVAAYLAKLDSICAAAQARVKNKIKAIPEQNQTAAIEARARILQETIPKLRALSLRGRPPALRGTRVPAHGAVLRISAQCAAIGIVGPPDPADPRPQQVHFAV